VPGILPVTSLPQIQRVTALCGASLRDDFVAQLSKRDDRQWQFQVGVEHAISQAQSLIDEGAAGIHFYVLNKSEAATEVLRALRLPAQESPPG
jgi:methylenetetrahydrofolate reductase (NADPH)